MSEQQNLLPHAHHAAVWRLNTQMVTGVTPRDELHLEIFLKCCENAHQICRPTQEIRDRMWYNLKYCHRPFALCPLTHTHKQTHPPTLLPGNRKDQRLVRAKQAVVGKFCCALVEPHSLGNRGSMKARPADSETDTCDSSLFNLS